ncbi:snoRNA binding domain, fibrillarin domain-containing protein [Trichoderma breve]|uniref:Nucleolar protein 58 n=1 Tax=Trichoderma breve TaxID=2034170 RepID=A0A9W9BEI5_9HYPO|nr:snoRNA binding domain, fibrillarin domain-containing protein [Trichoderma breve]KAJ4860924.1 snoRNA binding domain, fibrillarin domain-containing protein [Trichoderma breve]
MSLFVLAETPAGYGLLKATDKKMLKNADLAAELGKPERLVEMLKLKKFVKFDSAAMALEEAAALSQGQIPPLLSSLLEDLQAEKKASLAVADLKLGTAISNLPKLNVSPVAGTETMDLFRAVREHVSSLIPGLDQDVIDRMTLGLSHSMSRHKLKFSPDKVDSMIIQAIKMLDDIDKELNVYAMRTKEWYGWHFPEMAKTLNDNLAYARVVRHVGMRDNFKDADLSEILPEDVEVALKASAELSMGVEITEEDLQNAIDLADQVIKFTEYRAQLTSYLESRMRAIAPNLTALVGYLVGARLISHAGSVLSLAKAPGSTIQILGAEKALFRALKTKKDTPKYGIMYHSSLVGQATGKNKGKIARMLAAKVALGLRVDALGDEDEEDEEQRAILGLTNRIKLENYLRRLEGKTPLPKGTNVTPSGEIVAAGQFTLKDNSRYGADADGVVDHVMGDADDEPAPKSKKSKTKKPTIEVVEENDVDMEDAPEDSDDEDSDAPAKSVKKLSSAEYERLAELSGLSVKKFKRKYERGDVQLNEDGTPKVFSKKELKKLRKAEEAAPAEATPEKKKKRKADEGESESKKEKKQKKKSAA